EDDGGALPGFGRPAEGRFPAPNGRQCEAIGAAERRTENAERSLVAGARMRAMAVVRRENTTEHAGSVGQTTRPTHDSLPTRKPSEHREARFVGRLAAAATASGQRGSARVGRRAESGFSRRMAAVAKPRDAHNGKCRMVVTKNFHDVPTSVRRMI